MATINSFEELEIWQKARVITNSIYDLSETGNFSRDFGLRDQIRRASISIMSNIAEGFESSTQKSFIRYLAIAKASCGEVRSQLYIARDRKYVQAEAFSLLKENLLSCSRQIQGLIRYLESKPNSRRIREEGISYDL